MWWAELARISEVLALVARAVVTSEEEARRIFHSSIRYTVYGHAIVVFILAGDWSIGR
jgi:hypothetical protein